MHIEKDLEQQEFVEYINGLEAAAKEEKRSGKTSKFTRESSSGLTGTGAPPPPANDPFKGLDFSNFELPPPKIKK